jgi:hypothetical protein
MRDPIHDNHRPMKQGFLSVTMVYHQHKLGVASSAGEIVLWSLMIPPGSIVHSNTRKSAISSQRDWAHDLQRPIYFLMTGTVVCG